MAGKPIQQMQVPDWVQAPSAKAHFSDFAERARAQQIEKERRLSEMVAKLREFHGERMPSHHIEQMAREAVGQTNEEQWQNRRTTDLPPTRGTVPAPPPRPQAPPPTSTPPKRTPPKRGSGAVGAARRGVKEARKMKTDVYEPSEEDQRLMTQFAEETTEALNKVSAAEEARTEIAETQYRAIERVQRRRQVMHKRLINDMKHDREMIQYSFGDPKAVEQAMMVQQNPDQYSPTERAKAAMTLKEAQEPDPNRIFSDNPLKVILAAIAAASGAVGQAYGGGPNVGLQMINAAIDRDIEAQMAAREGRVEGLSAKERQTYLAMDQLDLKVNDALALKTHKMAVAEQMVRQAQVNADNAQVKQSLFQTEQGLKERRHQMEMDLANERGKQITAAEMALADTQIKAAHLQMERMRMAAQSGVTLDKGARGDLRTIDEVETQLDEIENLFSNIGWEAYVTSGLPGTEAHTYDILAENVSRRIEKLRNRDRMTDKDAEAAQRLIGTSWRTKNDFYRVFNFLKRSLDKQRQSVLQGGVGSVSVQESFEYEEVE